MLKQMRIWATLLLAVAGCALVWADAVDNVRDGTSINFDLKAATYTYDGILSGSGSGAIEDSEAPPSCVAKNAGTLNIQINARDLGLPFDIVIPLTGTKINANEIRWTTNTLVNRCIRANFQGTETDVLIKRVSGELRSRATSINPVFNEICGRGMNVDLADTGGNAQNFINAEVYLFCSETFVTRVDFEIRNIDFIGQAGLSEGELLPSAFQVTRGQLSRGELRDLFTSDDSRVVVQQRSQFSPALANAEVTTDGTAPQQIVGGLALNVELASNGVPSSRIIQRVEAFNYSTGRWDLIDERNPTTGDTALTLAIPNPAQYIQAGTRAMRARAGWYDRGSLAPAWGGIIDRLTWSVAR
jgi:hypothetical protein